MGLSADIFGAGRDLQARAKNVVTTVKERRASRENQKRQVAQYGLTRIATVLSKTVDDIRQRGLPDYSLSFLDEDQGIILMLEGTGLNLAFDGDQIGIEHREKTQGIPTRCVLSFNTYQEGKYVVDEAKVQFAQATRATEYPLTLNPQEIGFEEDGVVRQLSRNILEHSRGIFDMVTEEAREQLREVTPSQAATTMEESDNLPLTQEQQYLLQNPFPDVISRIPPIAPYKPLQVEDASEGILPNNEKAPSIARSMEGAAQVITRLGVVNPEDLPYTDRDQQLARYVAANSLFVYAGQESQPIGILCAQPDDGTLMFQLFSEQTSAQPTLFFRDPAQAATSFHNIETLQVGYAPYANPYDINHTHHFPVGLEEIKSSTLVAQAIIPRLMTDKSLLDFDLSLQAMNSMPYIGMEPQTFFAFAEQTLTAAIPDKEAVKLEIDYFDYSVHGKHLIKTKDIPDFALSTNQKGNKNVTQIWFDEALQTTTIQFEITKGEDSNPNILKLSYDADSFTVTYITPEGPKSKRITPELFEDKLDQEDAFYWREALSRIGKQVRSAEDVWSMVQGRYKPFVTDTAKLQINGLFDDLAELIRKKGNVPNMAAYVGGNAATSYDPLYAGPDKWLPTGIEVEQLTIDGKREKVPLERPLYAPSDLELEGYPARSFLGELAREARMSKLENADTDEHRIVRPGDTRMSAGNLVEADALPYSLVNPPREQASAGGVADESAKTEIPSGAESVDGNQVGAVAAQPHITKPLKAVKPEGQTQVPPAPSQLDGLGTINDALTASPESLQELGFLQKEEKLASITSIPPEARQQSPARRQTRQTPASIAEGAKAAKEKAKSQRQRSNSNGKGVKGTTGRAPAQSAAEKGRTTRKPARKSKAAAPKGRTSQRQETRNSHQERTSPSSRRRNQDKTK